METEGIYLDLQTISKLREDFRTLSGDLRYRLDSTNDSIEQAAKTWQDNNFLVFHNAFKKDKERLEPLFQRVDIFEQEYLTEVEMNLREYLELQNGI